MKTTKILAVLIVWLGILLSLEVPTQVRAQSPPDQAAPGQEAPDQAAAPAQTVQAAPAQDPPSRAARLSYSSGSVSLQPGGEGDWVEAVRNRPLTTGDNLWAHKPSRAAVQLGSPPLRIDS